MAHDADGVLLPIGLAATALMGLVLAARISIVRLRQRWLRRVADRARASSHGRVAWAWIAGRTRDVWGRHGTTTIDEAVLVVRTGEP